MTEENLITRLRIEGAAEYMTTFAAMRKTLLDLGYAHKPTIDAMNEATGYMYAMRRAQTAVRTSWRVYHAELVEGARVMRDIGAIGRSVVQMWQAYTIAQTRVADSARDLRVAQDDVVIIQDALSRAMRSGDLELVTDLSLRLSRAQNQVTISGEMLKKAQQDNIIGYVGMALQLGDIIGRIPIMALHLSTLMAYHTAGAAAVATETGAIMVNTGARIGSAAAIEGQFVLNSLYSLQAMGSAIIGAETGAMWSNTAARVANTAAIGQQSAALSVLHALSGPVGWAALAGAGVALGAYAASRGGGGGGGQTNVYNVSYQPTLRAGATPAEQSEYLVKMMDSLRRRGAMP